MDKILLIGAGGHARSCIDVLEEGNQFEIAGLVEKGESISNESLGYPVIGTDDDLKVLRQQYKNALVTVGQIKSPAIRVKLYQLLQKEIKMLKILNLGQSIKTGNALDWRN